MPVHNAEFFLREAIESILNQTYKDFVFLIIDDCSTDSSYNIVSSYSDSRIVLRRNVFNKGVVDTLNEAFGSIKATYIIRMDADDIAVANRIEEQVSFMDMHPDIAISGTWYSTIETSKVVQMPVNDAEIAVHLLETTALGHPTVIIRQDIWNRCELLYRKAYLHAEDYACWCEAKMKGCKLANIPLVLLNYRRHGSQISQTNCLEQKLNSDKIRLQYFEYYFPDYLGFNKQAYNDFFSNISLSYKRYLTVKKLYSRIIDSNKMSQIFNNDYLQRFLIHKLNYKVFQQYIALDNPEISTLYFALFDINFYKQIPAVQKIKFFVLLPVKSVMKFILFLFSDKHQSLV